MRKEIWLAAAAFSAVVGCGGETDRQSFYCAMEGELGAEINVATAGNIGHFAVGGIDFFVSIDALAEKTDPSKIVCVQVVEANSLEGG